MSIPEQGFPRLAEISPRVQVAEFTASTNADVLRMIAEDPQGWPHLSVYLTDDQRSGRGRMGREWVTPPGTALAVSVVVTISGLPLHSRGWIPLLAGVNVAEALSRQLPTSTARPRLKWPNDVLVDGQKIAGILTEGVPQRWDVVVVGIGVNTDMAEVPVPTATSLMLLGVRLDADRFLTDYLSGFDHDIAALLSAGGNAQVSGAHARVSAVCATIGSQVTVSQPGGRHLQGLAEQIDGEGRLVVQNEGISTPVSAGDVTHVR